MNASHLARRWSRLLPLLLALVVVLGGMLLHADNDGLWYQGDSPRHFMNGVFWGDFAQTLDPLRAQEFALAYYLRYPAIAPTIWPPFVYALEALAFAVTGPSMAVARGIIGLFALLGAGYLVLLLRRWGVGTVGQCVAAWAVSQPLYLLWSNGVMMEIPALALGIASVFHLDRAKEGQRTRDLILAGAFLWACTMTRVVGIIVPAAYGLALLGTGRWRWLWTPRSLAVWGLTGLALVPWTVVNLRYGAIMVREAAHLGEFSRSSLANWTYYPSVLPHALGWPFLGLALVGIAVGLARSASRPAAVGVLLSMLVLWITLSLVSLKETRYVIGLLPFLAGAIALGVQGLMETIPTPARRAVGSTVVVGLVSLSTLQVVSLDVPRLEGMEDAVDAILRDAPGDRVLYDGLYDGVFTAYVRTHPLGLERAVVRGSKVFYATALQARFGLVENATDAESLVAIVADVGCRWLVVEREEVVGIEAARLVRSVLAENAAFEFVRSHRIDTHLLPAVTMLDVYSYRGILQDELEGRLSFPALEGGNHGQ